MQVSVVTPTYNRAGLLPRLYESLGQQTFTDFEWIVVDDGSADETRELVHGWDAPFPIEYVHQENAGMKVAWNRGVTLARGELVAVIGSDDWYLPHGLQRLVEEWAELDERFVSVNGRLLTSDGRLHGPAFSGTIDTDSFSYWYRYGFAADTIGVARTEIVRRYPFPYPESRGGPEALAFNRMARRYLTRFLDEPVAVADYQPDGLTARPKAEFDAETEPWLVFYWEAMTFPKRLPLTVRARFAANCARFGARRLLELARS